MNKIPLLHLVVTALWILVSLPCLADSPVAIRIIHTKSGAFDYFVGKKDGATLWTFPSQGPCLRDDLSGSSVLVSTDLIIVDRMGVVKNRLRFGSAEPPRTVMLENGILVYDTGNLAIGAYDPATDVPELTLFLRSARRVCAYNVRTDRKLWEVPETDTGLPLSRQNGELDTIRIVNLKQCLEHPLRTPVLAIDCIDTNSGQRLRSAVLSLKRTEALSIKDEILNSFGGGSPCDVTWTLTGVYVSKLFCEGYAAKGYSSAARP